MQNWGQTQGPEPPKSTPEALKSTPEARKSTPECPKADTSSQKCTESFPRASREGFFDFLDTKRVPKRVPNGVFFTQNRSQGRSGSENCDFFCKNAEVQQTPCFTSPNRCPQVPESNKIGRGGSKMERKPETMQRKTLAKEKHEIERQKLGRRSNF